MALATALAHGQSESASERAHNASVMTITHLTALAARSADNAIALWRAGVASQSLKLTLQEDASGEVRSAARKLTVTLSTYGLESLDDVALLCEKACEVDDARQLLLTLLQSSKGPPFVQFDMTRFGYSSLELPSLPRTFPPSTGYSISAWVRIDQYDPACHTTLFGAFDSTQSCFVLIYLEKDSHQLILQTSVRSSRPSVRFKSTRFVAGSWYHVSLVHRRNGVDPTHSPTMLFINGEFAEQVKCSYPEMPPEHEDRQAGASAGITTARRQRPVQAFFGTPHDLAHRIGPDVVESRWSLASAQMFASPLTDEIIAVQYRLGPRYQGNMQDCLGPMLTYRASAELNRYNELLHPEKSDRSDITTATEARGSDVMPESRLLISLSPLAVIYLDESINEPGLELDYKAEARLKLLSQRTRAIVLNAAIPLTNEAISRSYGAGMLAGDPIVAVPKSLDVATWCLAGSVPLLVRLLGSAHTKSSFLQAVATCFECIKDNWRISEAVEKDNGYGMLAMTIRDKLGFESILASSVATKRPLAMLTLQDRQSTPLPVLEQILDFIGYNKLKPEDSMIVNPMAYRVLLLDFDTWRRCDAATQKLYYQQFIHFVNHNRHQVWNQGRLNKMRAVKKLIDVLKSEEISAEVIASVKEALKALVDNHQAKIHYKELAMFITFGLQDERAVATRSLRHISSMVQFRQRAASWANGARRSRPSTPSGASTHSQQPQIGLSRYELAIHVLQLITDILCEDERSPVAIRRFHRTVPNRWLIHLLGEQDPRIVPLTLRIISRSLAVLGPDFKSPFVDKNGGFVTMKHRLKAYWKFPSTWLSCFAILFGRETPAVIDQNGLSVFEMLQAFAVDDKLKIYGEGVLPTLMAMLEAGLRSVVKAAEPAAAEASILKAVIQFLGELYARSTAFQQFAVESRYIQSLLFVLFPILVGSDRLSAETELQADKHSLSFRGEEVKLRPHSNSLGERPPSVRSLNLEDDPIKRSPSPRVPKNLDGPRRLSSFVMINPNVRTNSRPAQFNTTLAPTKPEPVKISIANTLVEALLEITLNLFTDLVCNRDKFTGIGLFLKVPPGFREHQAYFESYVLVNALSQLWNHLKLNQDLFLQTRVLTNLARYSEHMAEAVFEGWFIDGAQPVLDFTGQVLEYMQQPDVAQNKTVRLCSQYTSCIRVIFLRVTLWRLSELNEVANEDEAVDFLNKMNYWQTILFSSENNERLFTKLICFMLYRKLISDVHSVRLAAARLWRTVMVQKPSESATLITESVGAEQRHLSTGFMKLVSMDDEDFIQWVDENRAALDPALVNFLSEPWDKFVTDENRRNESNAAARLAKRRDRLQAWHNEETKDDETIHRFEVSTKNWTSNVHAQERVKLQRAVQDHQEIVSHLHAVFERTDKLMKQPCGVDPSTETPKWRLDETEALNRMRCRLLPGTEEHSEMYRPKRKTSVREAPNGNPKLTLNTQAMHSGEDIMTGFPASPIVSDAAVTDAAADQPQTLRPRAESVSNSQLLEGGFEMVDDPNQDHEGAPEDKNRKVMTRLQMGDGVVTLFNISRIIGLEALEGLFVVGKKCLYLQDDFFQRSDGEIVSATQAPEDERDPYVNLISGKDTSSSTNAKPTTGDQEIRHWTWAEVLSISKRRFLSRDVAVEIFFTDGRSYLITCISPKVRDELHKAIVSGAPQVTRSASLIAPEDAWRLDILRNPEEEPQSLGTRFAGVFNNTPSYAATKKWLKGEMSNFQYLMLINTMAGRTFNDLTQYPVFPWVLADYTSEELDLDNPRTFRNFAKPMGCQTASREAEFKDRYQQFAEMMDGREPPFHYGTHYSSAMIVSSYLIRLQPYVQSYLILQGGNFDHADRLFDSIGKAWSSASRDNMSDVRELTPEFFYLPEFLTNINKYDFGVKQGDGGIVNDVELPPWAKGDPQIFIEKHREALESPYVSEHLHEWIDLVFGFKQRGEAALEATNVFGHLSYPGATNLEAIEDRVQLLSTIWIIHSFGQTPHQVFQKTHPARESPRSVAAKLDTLAESLVRLPDPLYESDEKAAGLTFSTSVGRLLCDVPCRLNLLPNCDRFMQWGFADHSIRFFSSNTKRLLGLYEGAHVGAITSTVFSDSKTLITAGADCTIAIWSVTASKDLIEIHPKTYLFGHRKPVTLLAASRVFSTLLSASADGQVIIWGLNRLSCIRVLLAAGGKPLQAAKISNISGHVALCQGPNMLIYTINGHLLVRQKVCDAEDDTMTCCAFYEGAGNEWLERELIFTGHAHGVANAWALVTLPDGTWHLQLVKRLNHADASREDGGNTSVAVTAILPMPNAVYTGDENGRVWEWDCIARSASISTRGR
ncbi:beach-domain-containing protein [Teratosphaeria nubilosa]|uniref:Beige protein homolog 1 n=1 Tax=Teratosphaeria nubilosa TaxID=161662 RepID=A0A6G1LCX0_9PEZI|nr:beach-domain-containing protein [Teratosphaeria nubilosa]